MKNVKLKAKKRIVEGDAAATIDPNLQSLYEAVDGLQSGKAGSEEKFLKVAKEKYGVSSVNDLRKGMSLWLKVPAGGLALSGFIASISAALAVGYQLAVFFKFWGWKAGSALMKHTTTSWQVPSIGLAAVFASFVFYKIFKYIVSDRSEVSEGVDPSLTKEFNKVVARKAVLECEMLMQEVAALSEGEAAAADQATDAAEKADGICKRMFAWFKEKFKSGAKFVMDHPFVCVAFLIIIGYATVCTKEIGKLSAEGDYWRNAFGKMSNRAMKLGDELRKVKDKADVAKYVQQFRALKPFEQEVILKHLGTEGDAKFLAQVAEPLGLL